MAFAFANNTQNLNSSDKISYSKSKTNYNYLRLVSLKQNLDNKQPICSSDKYFSSYSGNVILQTAKITDDDDDDEDDDDDKKNPTLSKLISSRSYDLLSSINKGFYLPTTISNNDNNINRPPYTYDPSCNEYFIKKDDTLITNYRQPNTSGDLQDILFNEYLDFKDAKLITNTQFNTNVTNDDDTKFAAPFKSLGSNQLQITDASFGDYIIDPENILDNFKDCNLTTFLSLTNQYARKENNESVLQVINWKKIDIHNFPNNKFHRYSITKPIMFFNYDGCSSPSLPNNIVELNTSD